jgi:hypothetical protein
MKGLSQIMRQAQEMQANMQKVQNELAATEVEGVAGGGMVKVVVTCKHEVKRGSGGGRVQRREPQGRADRATKALIGSGGDGAAARAQAAVLVSPCLTSTRRF